MKQITLATLLISVVLLPTQPASADELATVIEKHIEARGGRDAWEAVSSLQITGDYTAFSTIAPFTLTRKRDHRARFDTEMQGSPYLAVFDGEGAWSIVGAIGLDWALPMGRQDFIAFRQETDFATPLFDYAERDMTAELIGESEIDGVPAIAIKLTRSDGEEETWYLDPETFLEIGRDSSGSDFGRPEPQRTFFDDFRSVGNVVLPFFQETQWYTRDRILEVDEVVINPAVDDAIFEFPPPTGMGELASLIGNWMVKVEHRDYPQAPFAESERTVVVEGRVRGGLLQETYVTDDGFSTVRSLSYDRFREVYRLAQISSFASYLDVLEGGFDDESRLVLTNIDSGTTLKIFGLELHERLSIFDIEEDSFRIEQESSSDGGETWNVLTKLHYTRSDG